MGLEVGGGWEGVWGAILEVTVGVGCWIMFVLGVCEAPRQKQKETH